MDSTVPAEESEELAGPGEEVLGTPHLAGIVPPQVQPQLDATGSTFNLYTAAMNPQGQIQEL
jgi:hypothetical protein